MLKAKVKLSLFCDVSLPCTVIPTVLNFCDVEDEKQNMEKVTLVDMKKAKRFFGLKTKIMIYTLIPVLISLTIIGAVSFTLLFNSLQKSAEAEFLHTGQKYVSAFENRLTYAMDYLSIVAKALTLQVQTDPPNRAYLQKIIFNVFDDYDLLDGSSIYFEPNQYDGNDAAYKGTDYGTVTSGRIGWYFYKDNGKTAYLPEGLENDIEFVSPHYTEAKKHNKPIYTNPTTYMIDGRNIPMFTITYPIHDQYNQFIGAITVDLFLDDIYNQLQNEKIYETGYVIISNDNDCIIYSPLADDIGKTREEAGSGYALTENLDSAIFCKSKSIINQKETLLTTSSIYIPKLDSHFYVSIAAPLSEINSDGIGIIVLIVIVNLTILILIALLLYYLIGRITKPIKEITESADRIASGDYHTRIAGNFKDEFAVVMHSVNSMADSIEAYIDESKNSLKTLKNILNGVDAFILVTLPETGEVLFINEHMRKHFNLENDVIGKYCYKLLQTGIEARCDFCPCHQLDKEPDKPVIWEDHNTVTLRHYRNTDCYIDWLGGIKAHLHHAVDITDLKAAMDDKLTAQRDAIELLHKKEQAEETSRMKSVFLANMSHEIRTPMNGILGFTELALDDSIPPKTKNYLGKIKTSAESLLQIINDILDISKIEADKIELEKIPFDLSEIFQLCRAIASPKAAEKGITLFCYAEPSVNKMLLGDPTRLRQILLNLLSNAVKFTNTGMVKLLSAVSFTTKNSVTIHFEVKDNGIGMTTEQVKKIFQPFVQADETTTRQYGGTGLGLSISKNLVERMGGELKVESALGIGSKFSFDLTFESIDILPQDSQGKEAAETIERPFYEGEILICEDNEMNQQVICDHLARVGLKTVIAANGKIGVESVKQRIDKGEALYDLIFMDIHMPVMDGLEAAKKLMEIGNQTPVIALTANIMLNDKETYFTSGMVDCLSKPFSTQELWDCLQKYLSPVGTTIIHRSEETTIDEQQHLTLITAFVKDHQATYKNINDAIETGDIKLAHRLAHTLKGVSGLIGMTMLMEAARNVEQSLADKKMAFIQEQMNALEYELNAALYELTLLVEKRTNEKPNHETLDKAGILALLDNLDSLLAADSFDSLNYLSGLNAIPGTELLVEQVENFMFEQARNTLFDIRNTWRSIDE